jgi:hypothetical protein
MAGRTFEGVTTEDEVSSLRERVDLRSLGQKVRDFWLEPFGQQATYFGFLVAAIFFVWVPLGAEIILILMSSFYMVKLRYKKMKWDFPFRVPISAGLQDGSTNGTGKGLMYLGSESKGKMPAYISDNDCRTHALIFGTTGSGKTEFLLGFVTNSLFYGGGSSYTDGKGDVKLLAKYMDLCRLVGREHDLLLISFITSGKEFYDRQETLASNTLNPYSNGSSGMCTEASIALMDSGGGDDMWKGRAIAFLGGLIKPLVFLRDRGEILLSGDLIRSYFDLPMLERFVYDEEDTWKGGIKRPKGYFSKTYGKLWDVVIRPLKAFMVTIPGYDVSKLGKQEQKTLEQHGYITMQLARLFGDLADNYGHIMDTPLGHVDMYDVVINNRILLTLLPALERSPESLGMLGKIIVGGIKQMAAGCLGNRTEGLRREIVDARPTNAPVPFPCIFDEYGYYAVLGFSSMPAQARSLGFMVVFAAQDFASLKKSSPEEADQTWENTNLRGIGRITSGSAAETYKRMQELGGNANVAMSDGYERVSSMWGFKLRRGEGVKIQSLPRVESDDLHSQADGEFHLFLGKKEKEGSKGRVRIARVNGFYTDLKPPPRKKKVKGKEIDIYDKRMQQGVRHLALNHFARVTAPAVLQNEEEDSGLVGPRGLLAQMRERDFKKLVQARELPLPRYSELIQIDALDRSWGAQRYGTVDAGVIGIVMTSKGNAFRLGLQSAILALSADIKKAAEGGGDSSSAGDSAASSGGGAMPERLMKPRKPAERISLHDKLTQEPKQVVSVPVTPNSPEEIRELVEDAKGVGFQVKHQDSVDAVRESIQTGVLEMEIDSLKNKTGIESAIADASGAAVGPEGKQAIEKQAEKLKVYLDKSTSYIDEPTPDLNSIRVSDSDAVANQLFMALSRPDAPWSSVVGGQR